MKICVECRWHTLPEDVMPFVSRLDEGRLNLFSLCKHPNAPDPRKRSIITGVFSGQYPPFCSSMRGYSDVCGPEGKLWEPKLAEEPPSD